MTTTPSRSSYSSTDASSSPGGALGSRRVTGWVGWVWFAGIVAFITGTANLINGLIAIFDDDYYRVTANGNLLVFDFTAWGWIHLVVGALLVVLGTLLLIRPSPAVRTAGVLLAGLNAIAQFAYLGVYPVMAIVVITLDVLVIWALLVHGQEAEDALD